MRLLLVDDEFFVRERIVRHIDWANLGVDDIRQAEDGAEAISVLREYSPDIILTDVRMPHMDGLQLAEEATRLYPDCKLIFISGFSDTAYLRTAIRLHAVRYVEKPIDMCELQDSIRVATDELRSERFAEDDLRRHKQNALAAQVCAAARGFARRETLQDALSSLQEYIDTKQYTYHVAAAVRLIGMTDEHTLSEGDICALITQIFSSDNMLCACSLKGNYAALFLFCLGSGFRAGLCAEKMAAYFSALTARLASVGLSAVYGVGCAGDSPRVFPESYAKARQALTRCYYKGYGCVCYYHADGAAVYNIDHISLSDFSHALEKDTPQHFIFLLKNLASTIKSYAATPPNLVIRFCYAIAVLLMRTAEKNGVALFENFQDEYDVWDTCHRMPQFDDLIAFLTDAALRYYSLCQNSTHNTIANKIVRYIHQNYRNPDLCVTMIADAHRLSPTYICHLFKKTMGITLGNYMTQVRMRAAQELMERGVYRVKEIAKLVGYRDGNYFSYKFKKETGASPGGVKQ